MEMSVSPTPRSIMNFRSASGRMPRQRMARTVGTRGSSQPVYSPASMAFRSLLVLKGAELMNLDPAPVDDLGILPA